MSQQIVVKKEEEDEKKPRAAVVKNEDGGVISVKTEAPRTVVVKNEPALKTEPVNKEYKRSPSPVDPGVERVEIYADTGEDAKNVRPLVDEAVADKQELVKIDLESEAKFGVKSEAVLKQESVNTSPKEESKRGGSVVALESPEAEPVDISTVEKKPGLETMEHMQVLLEADSSPRLSASPTTETPMETGSKSASSYAAPEISSRSRSTSSPTQCEPKSESSETRPVKVEDAPVSSLVLTDAPELQSSPADVEGQNADAGDSPPSRPDIKRSRSVSLTISDIHQPAAERGDVEMRDASPPRNDQNDSHSDLTELSNDSEDNESELGEDEYEVERILKTRIVKRTVNGKGTMVEQYQVKWKGWPISNAAHSWLSLEDLSNCPELLDEFNASRESPAASHREPSEVVVKREQSDADIRPSSTPNPELRFGSAIVKEEKIEVTIDIVDHDSKDDVNGPARRKRTYVSFVNLEDNTERIDLHAFNLGPCIHVPKQYHVGFSRKVISDAFGGGFQDFMHNWPPYYKPERYTFLTAALSWHPWLTKIPGQHCIGFMTLGRCPVDPVNIFVGLRPNEWMLLGSFKYERYGEVSCEQLGALDPKVLDTWINGMVESTGWGVADLAADNADLPADQQIAKTPESIRAAMLDGRMAIPFTILQCVGYPIDWFDKLQYAKAHPKPFKNQLKKRGKKRKAPAANGSPRKKVKREEGVVIKDESETEDDEPRSDDDFDVGPSSRVTRSRATRSSPRKVVA
ncbi:hypothetical protein MKEN_00711100 [Mycena kentingensis (nom. inval.)]|nr:hypothetical protein MKEN_00711100 [Mycena kentingensis (nom. inval.)]